LGRNDNGQLGDGSRTHRSAPVQVTGLSGVVSVAAGDSHSLAVRYDGSVWAWGYNSFGQLGDGSWFQRLAPVQVTGLSGRGAVAASSDYSMAVRYDGTVWAWGFNLYGQLGNGTTSSNQLVPVQVQQLRGVVAVEVGSSHSLALRSDGTVWTWGYNSFGQLGNGPALYATTAIRSLLY
jgi:alpha-tubulin suppressor-like RCC1 family protein